MNNRQLFIALCFACACCAAIPAPTDAQASRPTQGDAQMPSFHPGGTPLNGVRMPWVTFKATPGAFPVVAGGTAAPIVFDAGDYWLVRRAAGWLDTDLQKVTGQIPELDSTVPAHADRIIIIGSVDRSFWIRRLVALKKLHLPALKGQWESYRVIQVPHPFRGIGEALVIVGSDRRGTAYGALDLSRQAGVSPWYWWGDVPTQTHPEVFVPREGYFSASPGVKYRGIFINDEAPAFSGWTHEKFGGVNHQVYEKMFELLLRLKGNYLWPAMWGNAFNDDDTLDPVLANQYGIVMGTSHHEPMLRAQQEWKRYGKGPWNYATNDSVLRAFWKVGIEHMDHHESIVTVGMRGDGDMPMSKGSDTALLEKIVADQRKIIAEVTGKPASQTPQDWALYKEVQDYYLKGMRVPDDVTLLLCDDNWGNLRMLPKPGAARRKGGFGVYYHFDYVGGPRNYKWLNSNSIPRTWEQMHLAYENDVRQIWVVNVGDLKPMELPISFFLDFAWDPNHWPVDRMEAYTRAWALEQFGPRHAVAIGHLLSAYTFYNSRRKPELLAPDVYNLVDYREAERIASEYDLLRQQAEALYPDLPADQRDAYYELVLWPIEACANLNDLYRDAGLNHLYAAQGRAGTNALADSVRTEFARDSQISYTYNHVLAGGKWDHMADQTHIGYTYWQEPRKNTMPKVFQLSLPHPASMGLAVEGSESWWGGGGPAETADSSGGAPVYHYPRRTPPGYPPPWEPYHRAEAPIPEEAAASEARLPAFSAYLNQRHYIDLFNRGTEPYSYTVTSSAPWVKVSIDSGIVYTGARLWVTIDGASAPPGHGEATLTVHSATGTPIPIHVEYRGRTSKAVPSNGFVENEGYVAMNADHYSSAVVHAPIQWVRIPEVGRNGTGMTTFPVTAPPQAPGAEGLGYDFYLFDTGAATIQAYCAPTLDYLHTGGRRFALSVDGGAPQVLHLPAEQDGPVWSDMVSNNIAIVPLTWHFDRPGVHQLRFWMVDPGVVLEKLVVDLGGVEPSYMGPPETPMQAGLKDYFRDDFPIGVSVMPHNLHGSDSILIVGEFNSLTPENSMKMAPIHPGENTYRFTNADSIVDFAIAHGLRVRGHNLCWHEQTPHWLFVQANGDTVSKTELLDRLRRHIDTVVGRYKGKVYAWDVVNEAISDDSTEFLRNSPWYRICGEDFIKEAFRYAHHADPNAQLFYNDYNTERPEKRERVYHLLKDLVDDGVPITGVGLQGHWSLQEPTGKDLRDAIEEFSSLGLKVQITELDVSVYPWEKFRRARRPGESDAYTTDQQAIQDEQYRTVFDIFREYKDVINGVTFWNVTDRHTWLDNYPVPGRKNYPLLFDVNGQPKEAYWDVVDGASP